MTRQSRAGVARPIASTSETPTVASLGLRLHLRLSHTERAQALADLIAAHERLCGEQEALFRQVIALLETADRRPE